MTAAALPESGEFLESDKITIPGGIRIDSGIGQPISCPNTD